MSTKSSPGIALILTAVFEVYFTHHNIHPCEAYNSGVSSVFAELCSHHLYVVSVFIRHWAVDSLGLAFSGFGIRVTLASWDELRNVPFSISWNTL